MAFEKALYYATATRNSKKTNPIFKKTLSLLNRNFQSKTVSIEPYSTQEISETLSVSDKESVNIFSLTAGIPTLLSSYDTRISLEENVKAALHINSPFNRLMSNKMCAYWLKENINSISTEYIDTKDSSYQNIKIGGITFDYAYEKKRAVYAYYDTTLGGKLTQKLLKEIEKSTTKNRLFYENEYIICTVNRVPDSYWTLSKSYGNVHIVPLKSLFTTYNKEYNRRMHPRFVPSFV